MAVDAARPDVSIARPISRADPIANSEMSRLARAFGEAAVGHDHRAGRDPRPACIIVTRVNGSSAGRDGHCREEAEGDRAAVAARRRGT